MKNEISLKLKHFFGGGGSGRIATTSTQGMLVGFVLRFFRYMRVPYVAGACSLSFRLCLNVESKFKIKRKVLVLVLVRVRAANASAICYLE